MDLFISNCTHQTHLFNYKVPERFQPFGQTIKPGAQIKLTYPPEVCQYIIDQHTPYGLANIKDVKPGFSGICYSEGKPCNPTAIQDAYEQKQEDLENTSQQILENSAAALTHNLQNTLNQAGSETPLGDVEMKITGEAINKDADNAPKLDKKIIVDTSQKAPRAPRGSKKK